MPDERRLRVCFTSLHYGQDVSTPDLDAYLTRVPIHRELPRALAARGHQVELVHLYPIDAEFAEDGVRYRFVAPDALGRLIGSAVRRGVRFPLLEAGMGKPQIRAAARTLGLPNWNKPSFACLSSRIPHGTQVTVAALRQIETAEAALKALGFTQVRVRHHGDVARIEVDTQKSVTANQLLKVKQ